MECHNVGTFQGRFCKKVGCQQVGKILDDPKVNDKVFVYNELKVCNSSDFNTFRGHGVAGFIIAAGFDVACLS